MLYIKCLHLNTKKYKIKAYNLRINLDYRIQQNDENYLGTDYL